MFVTSSTSVAADAPRIGAWLAGTRRQSTSARKRPGIGLIRFVMLWFALSLGVAIASPMVHPQAIELVCSSAGAVKAIVHTEDGAQELGLGHLDCPSCVLAAAPPAMPMPILPMAQPLGHAVQPIEAARIAAATAAPPPARGPPARS